MRIHTLLAFVACGMLLAAGAARAEGPQVDVNRAGVHVHVGADNAADSGPIVRAADV